MDHRRKKVLQLAMIVLLLLFIPVFVYRYFILYTLLQNMPAPPFDEINQIPDKYWKYFPTSQMKFNIRAPGTAGDYEIYKVYDKDTVLLMALHGYENSAGPALFDKVNAETFVYQYNECGTYAKDRIGAYYARNVQNIAGNIYSGYHCEVAKLENADLKTFDFISGVDGRARDKNGLYDHGNLIKNATIIDNYYVKDEKNIFFEGEIIEGADPVTFERMGNYNRDKNRVYYLNTAISADAKTFSVFPQPYGNNFYAKDKDSVFYEGKVILGADLSTFAANGTQAKDKNHVYFYGKINSYEDPKAFRLD